MDGITAEEQKRHKQIIVERSAICSCIHWLYVFISIYIHSLALGFHFNFTLKSLKITKEKLEQVR